MNFFGFYVLNLQPTILSFITGTNQAMYSPPPWLKPDAVLEHIPWWHGRWRTMMRRKARQLVASAAGIEHHLMVHARDEERLRRLCRVRGALVSQNIYIREDVFESKALEKTYDAIYVAQLKSFKRHELASEIRRIYVACGGDLKSFSPALGHADYNLERLEKWQLAEIINRSHCSLALSRVEGQMLASFESLLCGVPVVTTPSKGGRDEFLDRENSIVVEPDANAVAAAVQHWKAQPADAQRIRSKALEALSTHRNKFCAYVSTMIERRGGGAVSAPRLYRRYFERPEGISGRFIWADKFDDSSQLERVQND